MLLHISVTQLLQVATATYYVYIGHCQLIFLSVTISIWGKGGGEGLGFPSPTPANLPSSIEIANRHPKRAKWQV